MCGVVRVKVGVIVIATVTVIGFDLRCIRQLFCQITEYRVRPESWVRGNWRGYKFRVIVSDNGVKGRGDRGYNTCAAVVDKAFNARRVAVCCICI